jgi:hypothetical protein
MQSPSLRAGNHATVTNALGLPPLRGRDRFHTVPIIPVASPGRDSFHTVPIIPVVRNERAMVTWKHERVGQTC